jgi:3-phenylpropionate/trans-cinnamate dioxygenase ferredoxin reductase subunit
MTRHHQIWIDGACISAQRDDLLLDAALKAGIDLPYDCRAGHCGTCCVRLISGDVEGGEGSEPGIVHACQCRVIGDAVIERQRASDVRTIEGVLSSLRGLSPEVVEVGITTKSSLLHHAGQYAQVRFRGYPSRPFSITFPVSGDTSGRSLFFHIRRVADGRVTQMLGTRIKLGHRVAITGPLGSAHFRPHTNGRLILVATGTGFAPIWSIATAALRENPQRKMMVIAGGRSIASLYMGEALERLARFPHVLVLPVCSSPQTVSRFIRPGRPTDFLPRLLPTDVLHVCGAPGMVDAVKSIAASAGASCYADPFVKTTDDAIATAPLPQVMRRRASPTRWPLTNLLPFLLRRAEAADPGSHAG